MGICFHTNITWDVRLVVASSTTYQYRICIFYRKRTTEIERKNQWVTQHQHRLRRRRRMLGNISVECNSLLVYFFLYLQYIQDTRYIVLSFPIKPLKIHLKFLNPDYDVRFKLLLKRRSALLPYQSKCFVGVFMSHVVHLPIYIEDFLTIVEILYFTSDLQLN